MATSVTITSAVCPRLFEFLTTLTFGAQRQKSVCQQLFRPPKQKETRKARCPHAISNLSRVVKNTTSVGREVRSCWRRCVGCCVCYVCRRSLKNYFCNRTKITPLVIYPITLLIYPKETVKCVIIFARMAGKDDLGQEFRQGVRDVPFRCALHQMDSSLLSPDLCSQPAYLHTLETTLSLATTELQCTAAVSVDPRDPRSTRCPLRKEAQSVEGSGRCQEHNSAAVAPSCPAQSISFHASISGRPLVGAGAPRLSFPQDIRSSLPQWGCGQTTRAASLRTAHLVSARHGREDAPPGYGSKQGPQHWLASRCGLCLLGQSYHWWAPNFHPEKRVAQILRRRC